MASLTHFAGTLIGSLWGLGAKGSNKRSQILMYHTIGGRADGDSRGLYSIRAENFVSQMTLLKNLVDDQVLRVVPFGCEEPGTLSITFDDGYLDNFTIVQPKLHSLGFPFHVFVNPSFVNSGDPGFLTKDHVAELGRSVGVTLGVHGYSHEPLANMPDGRILEELTRSREWLEDLIDKPVSSMSYPHGSTSRRVSELAGMAKFQIAACSKFGPISPTSSRMMLPRIDVWSTDTSRSFASKINGGWDWMRWLT